MAASLFPAGFHVPHRLMGAATFAETVVVVTEPTVIQRGQHLRQCLLDQAIQHRRHAQRTLRPVGFGNEHPAHGRRTVRSRHERGAQPWPLFPAERRKRFDGHPVHAGCPCVRLDTFPSRLQVLRC